MRWTDEHFDELCWHDNHVHGIRVESDVPEHGTGRLTLDLDYIREWICPSGPGGRYRFKVVPANLTFVGVSDLKIEIDWAAATAGMTPFSIEGIERKKLEYPNGSTSWAWRIKVNWPLGAITFHGPSFVMTASGPEVETDDPCLLPEHRGAG